MTGTYQHNLDEKGRIIIPARLRAGLTEHFYIMLDEDFNLAMMSYETGQHLMRLCEEWTKLRPYDQLVAATVERTASNAEEVRVETEAWRVPISDMLREKAYLDREVVTVGMVNRAIVWDRGRWEATQKERMDTVDVRRMQAALLRAAASGALEPPRLEDEDEEEEIDYGRVSGHRSRSAAASARHGRRSPPPPTLSELDH
jgi:MraZ protein